MAAERHESGRPWSTKELGDIASRFEWKPNIGLKYWARSAETIYHEGLVALQEDRIAAAYIFFLRYATLILDYVQGHPEIKTPEGNRVFKPLRARVQTAFQHLEVLRPRLQQLYNEWERSKGEQRDRERDPDQSRQRSGSAFKTWNPIIMDAEENSDLAVDLYKKEMHRRLRQSGLSPEEVSRRRAAGVWNSIRQQSPPKTVSPEDLRSLNENARRLARGYSDELEDDSYTSNDRAPEPRPVRYHYPSIGKSAPLQYDTRTSLPGKNVKIQPSRPPKEALRPVQPIPPKEALRPVEPAPPRPREALDRAWPVSRPAPAVPEKRLPPGAPPASSIDIDTPPPPPKHAEGTLKQKRITFSAKARLESGDPLRPVFFPRSLRKTFLELAAGHLRANIEMCGLLCGTIVNNALFITCLVIPEQKGTSDTCEVENDVALVEFYMAEELITIGWIHTHPTQSCFMSSHDLHTHAGYQRSIAESFAIVCAPRQDPSWGVFRLTDPPGLPYILECNQGSAFHPHTIDNIYTDAGGPGGHVYETDQLDLRVVDLRPSKAIVRG